MFDDSSPTESWVPTAGLFSLAVVVGAFVVVCVLTSS